jgi:hypothetical protein
MFLGLRRLGKKAWLLQYENEGHHVLGWQSSLDYTTRITQFFDHYLKGEPAPVWMTEGVPAKLRGQKTGLEYNHKVTTPGAGLPTPWELERINKF